MRKALFVLILALLSTGLAIADVHSSASDGAVAGQNLTTEPFDLLFPTLVDRLTLELETNSICFVYCRMDYFDCLDGCAGDLGCQIGCQSEFSQCKSSCPF